MKSNSAITQERLRTSVSEKSGCNNLFLRVLKSDLNNLLSQYMQLDELEILFCEQTQQYNLQINITAKQFYQIGRNQE